MERLIGVLTTVVMCGTVITISKVLSNLDAERRAKNVRKFTASQSARLKDAVDRIEEDDLKITKED